MSPPLFPSGEEKASQLGDWGASCLRLSPHSPAPAPQPPEPTFHSGNGSPCPRPETAGGSSSRRPEPRLSRPAALPTTAPAPVGPRLQPPGPSCPHHTHAPLGAFLLLSPLGDTFCSPFHTAVAVLGGVTSWSSIPGSARVTSSGDSFPTTSSTLMAPAPWPVVLRPSWSAVLIAFFFSACECELANRGFAHPVQCCIADDTPASYDSVNKNKIGRIFS